MEWFELEGTWKTISSNPNLPLGQEITFQKLRSFAFLGFGNEAHCKPLTRGEGAAMDHFGASTEAALSWFTAGGWDVASCGTQRCPKATMKGKRWFKTTLSKGSRKFAQFTFSSGNMFFSQKGFVVCFPGDFSLCQEQQQLEARAKLTSTRQSGVAEHSSAASGCIPVLTIGSLYKININKNNNNYNNRIFYSANGPSKNHQWDLGGKRVQTKKD